jgi:holo-[acyl-carrier protein] synthase
MIIGIGIDLISNDRIKKILKKFDKNFKEKIFSKNELNDFECRYKNQKKLTQNAINFFAKRFASKEAFSKALGTGIGRGIDFNDIEIFNDQFGKPFIRILNNKDEKIQEILNCKKYIIHLTISDEKSISGAVVIIEKVL